MRSEERLYVQMGDFKSYYEEDKASARRCRAGVVNTLVRRSNVVRNLYRYVKDLITFTKVGWGKSPNKFVFFLVFIPKWRTSRSLIKKLSK